MSPAPGSVADGVDVGHTGFLASDELVPPLVRRWSVKAAAAAILAADGRVYATRYGSTFALDQRDGKVLWSIPEGSTAAAYDGGILFVPVTGGLRAYSADSGRTLWTRQFGEQATIEDAVATGGIVYTVDRDKGRLHALRASDGSSVWENQLSTSGVGAAAVGNQRVFVAGGCPDAEAIDRASGQDAWNYDTGCSSGFRTTPALTAGRLWVPVTDTRHDFKAPIFDAANGNVVRYYEPSERPVFVDGLAVLQNFANLQALNADSGTEAWHKEKTVSNLIAIGHDIYGFADDRGDAVLTAFDSEKGEQVWATDQGFEGVSTSDTGKLLAAAPGLLIAQADGRISAWESALRPTPNGIAIGASATDVASYSWFGLIGVLGRDLRGAQREVTLEGANWPRGRFRPFGKAQALRDGGFFDGIRTERNARLRVSAGGAHSNAVTVYAYPRVRLGRPVGTPRRAKLRAYVKSRGVRLNGRTLVLYYQRAGKGRLTRLGSGRLRGRRRGGASASIAFRPVRRTTRRDLVWHCIKGQLRLGLGRPSPLTRRCGVRTLRRP